MVKVEKLVKYWSNTGQMTAEVGRRQAEPRAPGRASVAHRFDAGQMLVE
jgi:hypothetical protein